MIVTILSIVLSLIFAVLTGFHIYWIFGGRFGVDQVIPTKDNNTTNIPIPKLATLAVALVMGFVGLMYLLKSGLISFHIPVWLSQYFYWVIPVVFFLRAIGEFNYVGIFKKIKQTEFAKADTKVFIPLCLSIGLMGLLVQLLG